MSQPTAEEHSSLKKQYDQLLEKNQNDTIRIRQKEQALNQQLQAMQAQHQTQIAELQAAIASLQAKLHSPQPKAGQQQQSKRVGELEADVRRLMDQNILLTSENTALKTDKSGLQNSGAHLSREIEEMKKYVQSLERDIALAKHKEGSTVSTITQQKIITQEQLNSLRHKIDKASHTAHQLRQQLKQADQDTQKAQQRERKAIQMLKKKEVELSSLESEINVLKIPHKDKKKTEASEKTCLKCGELQQEIQLLKQMVKSTQGMVRVKEIENEKFRMHSEQVISNQSRSSGKPKEKGTPLPPLSKKK